MKQPAIIKEILPSGQQASPSTDERMIHPHTYIHPNARVATNVKIDPFSVIHQDVEVGEGTWIGSSVTIMEGARIGKKLQDFPGRRNCCHSSGSQISGRIFECFHWG